MGRTTHSIARRGFHLLPFLLWSIVTAVAVERVPESTELTNIFAPESAPARMTFEHSLAVFGLTGVMFVLVGSLLVYAVVKFRVTAENAVSGRPR
jgi:hypothetical protein